MRLICSLWLMHHWRINEDSLREFELINKHISNQTSFLGLVDPVPGLDDLMWVIKCFQQHDCCLTVLSVDNAINSPSLPTKQHYTLINISWRPSRGGEDDEIEGKEKIYSSNWLFGLKKTTTTRGSGSTITLQWKHNYQQQRFLQQNENIEVLGIWLCSASARISSKKQHQPCVVLKYI